MSESRLRGYVARSVLGNVTINTGTHLFTAKDAHLPVGAAVEFITRDHKTAERITLIGMTDLRGNVVAPGKYARVR
jgi:hypothetical protein